MASRLSNSFSLEGGHDAVYDQCCTICEDEELNAEALYYCRNCDKFFCDNCVKNHNKFVKDHQVLGKKENSQWGDALTQQRLGLSCEEHAGKELEMYCADHDKVCCNICINISHRGCSQINDVSDVAKGIHQNTKFKQLATRAENTKTKLIALRDKRINNYEQLQEARSEMETTFQNLRENLMSLINKIVDESSDEMSKHLSYLEKKIEMDKDACSHFHKNISKTYNETQKLGKKSEIIAFQGFKKCTERIDGAEKILKTMQDVDYQLQFSPDSKIEECLSSLKFLGKFNVTPSCLDDDENKTSTESVKLSTSPDHVYRVVERHSFKVRQSDDTKTCDITGMCQLPGDSIALLDNNNNKVKLLNSTTYSIIDEYKLPPDLCDACHTRGSEFAVTVCAMSESDNKFVRKEIHFFNARTAKLSHSKTIQLDHECMGIAYYDGQLYVGSMNALYVYNMSGKKQRKFYKSSPGLFLGTRGTLFKFSFSADGNRIYGTNPHKNLMFTLDGSGSRLATFTDPELQFPLTVCVADNGTVFVCGAKSHSILQVDREGKRKMSTLVNKSDGISAPEALVYDTKTQRLFVGLDTQDYMSVLKLQ